MAKKHNKNKFDDDTPFDESLLIGSLSGFNSDYTNKKNNAAAERGGEEPAGTAAAEPNASPEHPAGPGSATRPENGSEGENNRQAPAPEADPAGSPVAVTPDSKPNLKTVPKPKPGKGWEHSRFLTPTSGRKEETVYISADLKKRIRAVLLYSGLNSIAMADYLENVLVEHFERYGPEIEELKKKFME